MTIIRGIVIRRRIFLERDIIVTVLTKDGRIIDLNAKGSRSILSHRRSYLSELCINDFFFKPRRDLPILADLKNISMIDTGADLNKLQYIYEILELMLHFQESDTNHPRLYECLVNLVNKEDLAQISQSNLTYTFQVIIDEMGIYPDFFNCGKCKSALEEKINYLDSIQTQLICQKCSNPTHIKISVSAQKLFRLYANKMWVSELQIPLSPAVFNEIHEIIRLIWETNLEKKLKSWQII